MTDGQYLDRLKSELISCIPENKRSYIQVIVDPSAASFIALLRQENNTQVIKANNDVLDGIRETNTAIQNGLIKVHKRCTGWLEEAQSYVWDKDSDTDRVIKEHDHFMDAMRYFVKTKRIAKTMTEYHSMFGR